MKSLKRIFVSLLSYTFALHSMGEVLPKVTFVTPSIVRVQWSPKGEVSGNETGVCIYEPKQVKVSTKQRDGKTVYRTEELVVEVEHVTGALTFSTISLFCFLANKYTSFLYVNR